MELFLNIIQMVLPVLTMLYIGYWCNKKQIINEAGIAGLNSVIGNITLPVVLFNAFFTAVYNSKVIIVFCLVFLSFGISLALSFYLKKFVKPYGKFMPFLMSSAEGGMLGYALFSLISGGETATFAMVDFGQTMFAYTVYLTVLRIVDGQEPSPKVMFKSMFSAKPFIGMLLGVVLGATGLASVILNSPVGGITSSLISFITAPTAGIILLIVGYQLSFRKEIMKPVLITVVLRLLVMALLCTITSLVLFNIIPFDKMLFMALMLMYALPAPFIIPLFAKVKEDGAYISTTLSVGTLATIAVFMCIATYSVA